MHIYIYIPCAAWSLVLRKGPYFVHGSYMNAKIRPFVKNTVFWILQDFGGCSFSTHPAHFPCLFFVQPTSNSIAKSPGPEQMQHGWGVTHKNPNASLLN